MVASSDARDRATSSWMRGFTVLPFGGPVTRRHGPCRQHEAAHPAPHRAGATGRALPTLRPPSSVAGPAGDVRRMADIRGSSGAMWSRSPDVDGAFLAADGPARA